MFDTDTLYEGHTNKEKVYIAEEAKKLTKKELKKLTKKQKIWKGVSYGLGATAIPLAVYSPALIVMGLMFGFSSYVYQYTHFEGKILNSNALISTLEGDIMFYGHLARIEDIESKYSNGFGGFGSGFSGTFTQSSQSQRGTFKACITVKDVKRVYREKAKKHHPDVGGDAETFKTLVVQYERALEIAQLTQRSA